MSFLIDLASRMQAASKPHDLECGRFSQSREKVSDNDTHTYTHTPHQGRVHVQTNEWEGQARESIFGTPTAWKVSWRVRKKTGQFFHLLAIFCKKLEGVSSISSFLDPSTTSTSYII